MEQEVLDYRDDGDDGIDRYTFVPEGGGERRLFDLPHPEMNPLVSVCIGILTYRIGLTEGLITDDFGTSTDRAGVRAGDHTVERVRGGEMEGGEDVPERTLSGESDPLHEDGKCGQGGWRCCTICRVARDTMESADKLRCAVLQTLPASVILPLSCRP